MGGQMTHPWASCMVHCTVQCTVQCTETTMGGHPGQGCHFLVDLTGMSMGDPSEGGLK